MKAQLIRMVWVVMLFAMTVSAFAQEESEAAAETTEIAGPMMAMLLLGVGALLAVGGAMASRSASGDNVA